MSSINNIGSTTPIQPVVTQPIQKEISAEAPKQVPITDKLELSGVSYLLQTLKTNDVRTEKVAAIKASIADGSYEDDNKLNVATDRLLDDLGK